MAGRSHRHRVPTARPPAAALGILYVWGRGAAGGDLRSYLQHEQTSVDDRDDVARKLAGDHGCPVGEIPDAWAWRLDGADWRKIDELTRDDRAVMGWTRDQHERCAPSVALRNALNAVARDEITSIAQTIERFIRPGQAPGDGGADRWIARDGRIVFFDAQREEWQLGDYAGG
jgi:hypothetical protein